MELNTTKAHGSVTEITVRVLKAPKTDRSIRKVYIPSSVAILLAELREEQKETIEALGDMYENYNLVLATSYGLPLGESYLRDKMQEVIDREGLPDVVFHSLRHTSEYTCLRSFISWRSRRKTHNLLHKMCSLSFIQRKRLTNIFNETSKPSSFCCLPIITIGVVDYRHCNQKNLKIYLSTLHKSV